MAKPSAYLETTVVSVLTARPTRDVVQTACQQITREWWDEQRARFEVFISQPVLGEARMGDTESARRRLAVLNGLPELAITAKVERLAGQLAGSLDLPTERNATMNEDPIAEVRRHREALAAEFGYDLSALCAHLRRHQGKHGHKLADRSKDRRGVAKPARRSVVPA